MRHIRRAAVTGLFAIWLAPLSAVAEPPKGTACCAGQGLQAERSAIPPRRGPEDEPSEAEGAPAA